MRLAIFTVVSLLSVWCSVNTQATSTSEHCIPSTALAGIIGPDGLRLIETALETSAKEGGAAPVAFILVPAASAFGDHQKAFEEKTEFVLGHIQTADSAVKKETANYMGFPQAGLAEKLPNVQGYVAGLESLGDAAPVASAVGAFEGKPEFDLDHIETADSAVKKETANYMGSPQAVLASFQGHVAGLAQGPAVVKTSEAKID